jgi:tetratricopeptide (TPR) repeat protein
LKDNLRRKYGDGKNPFAEHKEKYNSPIKKYGRILNESIDNHPKIETMDGIEPGKAVLKAKVLITSGKLKQAQEYLEKVIFHYKLQHSDLYYFLGEAYHRQNNFSFGEEMLLKSLTFKVHSPYVYNSLA